MTKLEEQLKHLQTVRLPKEVRLRMREELMAYADLHAVSSSPKPNPFQFFSIRFYAGFAALLLIVGSVGGTAYAAEDTLPGDTLYSVKVGFTEPIQTALIPSDSGKASWHAILAERRLEEAAQLAAEDKLSPEDQTELAANFNAHVEASVSSADRLEKAGDAMGSLSVRSDLEARISAHERILTAIAGHYAVSTSTQSVATTEALHSLLASVQNHENRLIASRITLEDAIAPHASSTAVVAIATTQAADTKNAKQGVSVSATAKMMPSAADTHVQDTRTARTQEVENILVQHAALFAKFLPGIGSTTATTTEATSTQASSTEEMKNDSSEDEVNMDENTSEKIWNSDR